MSGPAFEGTLDSHTFSPAAITTWPSGAERVPAFATLGANSMSLPPFCAVSRAPACTLTLPGTCEGVNQGAEFSTVVSMV